MGNSGWKRAKSLAVALTMVLLLIQPRVATGVVYYAMPMRSVTAVNQPEVFLQSGIAGSSTIYMNETSAKVSVSGGGLQVGSDVAVAASSDTGTYMYPTQRHIVRTTDANKTIHVFFIDTAGYIQWYKSIDNGQTFSQALTPTQRAESLSVANDNANNIHLVYHRNNFAIYYRKQAYNATAWGTEITLDSGGYKFYPSISIAPYNDNWVYVVYDYHRTQGPKRNRWYFTYSTDGGSNWQTPWEGTLNEYTGANTIGTFPSIVIDNILDNYGHVYVTWFSGNLYLYLRRGVIGSTGAVTWDSTSETISSGMSSSSTTVNTNMIHSAVYVNGKYRVGYCESGTAKYRDWDEATWSTPISLAAVSEYPSLTHDESGYLYVFYETNVAHSNYDIRYQKSDDTTPTGFGSPQKVTDDNTGNHRVSTEVDGERIEFIRVQGLTSPFKIQYNYLASAPQDFDYVLKVVNNVPNLRKIRLNAYSDTNRDRLDNCTIYFYNGGGSNQIVIIDGNYENQTGTWYDLAASDTDYIAMHIEAPSGVSYIYVYLEILIPDTTIYARYIITFEIS